MRHYWNENKCTNPKVIVSSSLRYDSRFSGWHMKLRANILVHIERVNLIACGRNHLDVKGRDILDHLIQYSSNICFFVFNLLLVIDTRLCRTAVTSM